MIDLFLRAESEAAMQAALLAAGVVDDAGHPAEGMALDVIGPISRVTGTDENGDPVIQTIAGWHVNLRAFALSEDQIAALEPVSLPEPRNPVRVFL